MTSREFYDKLFEDVDEKERLLVSNLIDEAIELENDLKSYRGKPKIKFHPTDPTISKKTDLYKVQRETLQTYSNIIRILLNVLRKIDSSAQDELLKRLAEFE